MLLVLFTAHPNADSFFWIEILKVCTCASSQENECLTCRRVLRHFSPADHTKLEVFVKASFSFAVKYVVFNSFSSLSWFSLSIILLISLFHGTFSGLVLLLFFLFQHAKKESAVLMANQGFTMKTMASGC